MPLRNDINGFGCKVDSSCVPDMLQQFILVYARQALIREMDKDEMENLEVLPERTTSRRSH